MIHISKKKKKKKVYLPHKLVESNLKIWFVGAICLYRKNPVEQLQGLVISVPTWFFPIRPHQIGKAQIKGQGVHDHERKNKGSSLNSSLDEVSVRETKQEWLPQLLEKTFLSLVGVFFSLQ